MLVSRVGDRFYAQLCTSPDAVQLDVDVGNKLLTLSRYCKCDNDWRILGYGTVGGYGSIWRDVIGGATRHWKLKKPPPIKGSMIFIGSHNYKPCGSIVSVNTIYKTVCMSVYKLRFDDGEICVGRADQYMIEKTPEDIYDAIDPATNREYMLCVFRDGFNRVLVDVYSDLRIKFLAYDIIRGYVCVYNDIVTIFGGRHIMRYDLTGKCVNCLLTEYVMFAFCSYYEHFVSFVAFVTSSTDRTMHYQLGLYDLRTCDIFFTEIEAAISDFKNSRLIPVVPTFCIFEVVGALSAQDDRDT